MTSGKPITASTLHLIGLIKKIGYMKRLTHEEFLARAISVHGDRYDYSNTLYVNYRTNVLIRCNRCGKIFPQNPQSHLTGNGCRACAMKDVGIKNTGKPNYKAKHLVLGVGVNDLDVCARCNTCYEIWHSILQRTIDEKYKLLHKAYKDASICDEWLLLSNFKVWFDEHYVEGYCIDKDLLGLKSKVYSPDTCCFLPEEINAAITREKFKRELPIGVMKYKDKFKAVCRSKHLGFFNTVEESRNAYLKEKKKHLITLANKWKDKIEPRAYNALIKLDVENFFSNN